MFDWMVELAAHEGDEAAAESEPRVAPGKRTRTQGLPARRLASGTAAPPAKSGKR